MASLRTRDWLRWRCMVVSRDLLLGIPVKHRSVAIDELAFLHWGSRNRRSLVAPLVVS